MKQRGFAHLQIILMILVVAMIAGVGYFVYQSRQSANSSLDSASQGAGDAVKTSAGITSFDECAKAGNPIQESFPEVCTTKDGKHFTKGIEQDTWLVYESPGKEYTIRLADGWEMERYQKSASIYQDDNTKLALKAGTKATVIEVDGGKDFVYGLAINYADQNTEQVFTQGAQQTSLKTTDGLEVQKFYNVESGNVEGLGPANGSVEYYYVIRPSSKQVITATYTVFPGSIDYHEVIEKSLITAHFNK